MGVVFFGIIDKSGVFFTQIYYLSKEDSMLSWVFFFLKVIYEVLLLVSYERIHTQYDYLCWYSFRWYQWMKSKQIVDQYPSVMTCKHEEVLDEHNDIWESLYQVLWFQNPWCIAFWIFPATKWMLLCLFSSYHEQFSSALDMIQFLDVSGDIYR